MKTKWTPAIYAGGEQIDSPVIESEIRQLVESVEILGDRILGRKCVQDHIRDDNGDVLVALPEDYRDETLWFEILKVGKDCRTISNNALEKARLFMYFPEWDDGLHSLNNGLFLVSESMMEGRNPSVKPFVIEEPK